MSIVFVSLLFSLYAVLIVLSCIKTRDILNPVVLFLTPYSFAILLHFMGFSDYYTNNTLISVVIVYVMPIFLSTGIFIAIFVNSNRLLGSSSLNWARLLKYKLNYRILFLGFFSVFLLESAVFGIPLFSSSPTQAYMNYGLPIIHHLITLVYFAIIFMVALRSLNQVGGLSVLLVIVLSLGVFVLIFARMQALNVILTALISYYYFYNVRPKRVIYYGLIISFFFAMAFTFLGNLRTGSGSDYFIVLGEINNEAVYSYAQLYIYFTVSIQNFINLVSDIDSFSFGAYTLLSMIPLVDAAELLAINFIDYRSSPGLTTFSLGSSFFVDFGVFSYLVLVFLGYFIGSVYAQFRLGNVFATLCYLGVFSRFLVYGFFYDGLFVTNSVILIAVAYLFAKVLAFKKVMP